MHLIVVCSFTIIVLFFYFYLLKKIKSEWVSHTASREGHAIFVFLIWVQHTHQD